MGLIDCDSHVIETDETWSYMAPEEEQFIPRTTRLAAEEIPGVDPPRFWLVGDTWIRRLPEDSNFRGNGNLYQGGTLTMANPERRLEDIDALGIDVQVLISSFFIGVEIDQPLEELAVCRSYNRWMAEKCKSSGGRFRWLARPPMRLLDRCLEELEFAAANGAVGIHLHGTEHDMYLDNPYFYPLYEKAEDLGLSINVHIGAVIRRLHGHPVFKVAPTPPAFIPQIATVMSGFMAVLHADFHVRFPNLRWGFLEGGATWAPAVIQQYARFINSQRDFRSIEPASPDLLKEKNMFINVQSDEDIPYLVEALGEDILVAGTDYGHNDLASELDSHWTILDRDDVDPSIARKIVDTNGRRLFGLDPSFTPAPERTTLATPPHVKGAATADGGPILVRT